MQVTDHTARLDRLPLTKFHWGLLVLCGLGWMFDAMDILILGSALAALRPQWNLSPTQFGNIISFNLLGMFFGAALAGALADRFGRKAMFQATLLIYSVFTGVSAFMWNYGALAVARFLAGLGLGGELPVASTLLSEFSPAKHRGFLIVMLESFWAYGAVAAALIGYLVIPRFGWQLAFLIGALPAFYVFVLRRGVPESPRYLLSVGKRDEAEAVVRRAERAAGAPGPAPDAPPAAPSGASPTVGRAGLLELFSAPYVQRTVMLWALWFAMVYSYYGIFTWLPGLLGGKGFTLDRIFLFNLIITLAQIPGYFSAAYLVERWGRKPTVVTYLFLCAISAYFFGQEGLGPTPSVGQILLWGSLTSFFNLGAWGIVYTYTPELYPTRVRGTGAGFAAAFGRLGGIIAPTVVGMMLGTWKGNYSLVFIVFTIILLIGGLAVLVLGEETKGRSLEEIAK